MRKVERACAFTGHRPRKFPWGYDELDARCVSLKSVLTEQIEQLAMNGVTQFLSGMAEGVTPGRLWLFLPFGKKMTR